MKCPSVMQKASTLGSQGIIAAVAVSIVEVGTEVEAGSFVCGIPSVGEGTTEAVRVKIA